MFFSILTGNGETSFYFCIYGRWYNVQNFLSTVSFQIFISSNKFGSASILPHNLLSTAVSSFDPHSWRKPKIVQLGCRLLNLSDC